MKSQKLNQPILDKKAKIVTKYKEQINKLEKLGIHYNTMVGNRMFFDSDINVFKEYSKVGDTIQMISTLFGYYPDKKLLIIDTTKSDKI